MVAIQKARQLGDILKLRLCISMFASYIPLFYSIHYFVRLYYPPLGYAPGILATGSHPTWHLLSYIINQW